MHSILKELNFFHCENLTGDQFRYNTRCRLYKIQGFFVHNNPLRQKPKGVRAASVELQDRVTFNKTKSPKP